MFVMQRQQLRIEPLNKISEGLFLGDHVAASNKFILQRAGVTHILQVASGMYPKFPGKYIYKTVNIDDIPSANLKQHFAACHRFIEAALAAGGVVLVHCWAGVSRSATIVISFLMQKHGITA
jgi:dual specificity phosphatase 12